MLYEVITTTCHGTPYHTSNTCSSCHGDTGDSDNFANDGVAAKINTGTDRITSYNVCYTKLLRASCHSDPPPLTDGADAKVHNACGSCHTANGTLQSIAVGQNFTTGGDCTRNNFV